MQMETQTFAVKKKVEQTFTFQCDGILPVFKYLPGQLQAQEWFKTVLNEVYAHILRVLNVDIKH